MSTSSWRRRLIGLGGLVLLIAVSARSVHAQVDGFLLLDRALRTRPVRIVEISEKLITFRDEAGEIQSIAANRCIALTRTVPVSSALGARSLLLVSDGQRLPGILAVSAPADEDVVAWAHRWLEQVNVPLNRVSAVAFDHGAPIPPTGETDALQLKNGDRLDGFIATLGDPIHVLTDLDDPASEVKIPVERAASVALVTPPRPATGRRVWFADGTVLDVRRLMLSDDGFVRFETALAKNGGGSVERHVGEVNAVLFDAGAMVPLRTLTPSTIESAVPRYVVPAPMNLDENAPLGLGRIEYRGPILVRYAVPERTRRFAAFATLPRTAHAWGDFELVVRDDEREVFRARLNRAAPTADLNVEIRGSELTIELEQGENGPIQDQLILSRAMLLVR